MPERQPGGGADTRRGHRRGVEVAPAGRQIQPRRFDQRRSAADEGIEYDSVARGVGGQQLFDELRRELSGPGKGIGPYPFGDVEVALRKGRPVQRRGGEGVVQDHGCGTGTGGGGPAARRCFSLALGIAPVNAPTRAPTHVSTRTPTSGPERFPDSAGVTGPQAVGGVSTSSPRGPSPATPGRWRPACWPDFRNLTPRCA